MQLILDTATVLGGIAALWFFVQQFLARRSKVRNDAPTDSFASKEQRWQFDLPYAQQPLPPLESRYFPKRKSEKQNSSTALMITNIFVFPVSGIIAGLGFLLLSDPVAAFWVPLGGFFCSYGISTILEKIHYDKMSEIIIITGLFMFGLDIVGIVTVIGFTISKGTFPIKVNPLANTLEGLIFLGISGILGLILGLSRAARVT